MKNLKIEERVILRAVGVWWVYDVCGRKVVYYYLYFSIHFVLFQFFFIIIITCTYISCYCTIFIYVFCWWILTRSLILSRVGRANTWYSFWSIVVWIFKFITLTYFTNVRHGKMLKSRFNYLSQNFCICFDSMILRVWPFSSENEYLQTAVIY